MLLVVMTKDTAPWPSTQYHFEFPKALRNPHPCHAIASRISQEQTNHAIQKQIPCEQCELVPQLVPCEPVPELCWTEAFGIMLKMARITNTCTLEVGCEGQPFLQEKITLGGV